jgi:hypothetical protein
MKIILVILFRIFFKQLELEFLLLKVLVILKLNKVIVKLFIKFPIFGDAALKFGDEPINLVINEKNPFLLLVFNTCKQIKFELEMFYIKFTKILQ